MNHYSEGVCGDGAAILKDGQMITISEIVSSLNKLAAIEAKKDKRIAKLKRENAALKAKQKLSERVTYDDAKNLLDSLDEYSYNYEVQIMLVREWIKELER